MSSAARRGHRSRSVSYAQGTSACSERRLSGYCDVDLEGGSYAVYIILLFIHALSFAWYVCYCPPLANWYCPAESQVLLGVLCKYLA